MEWALFYCKMLRYNKSRKQLVVSTVKRIVLEAVNSCELPDVYGLLFGSEWEVFVVAFIESSPFLLIKTPESTVRNSDQI